MRIRYSAAARRELEEIRGWIAHDNPSRALSFVRELRANIEGLKDWPPRCELVDADADPDIHRLVHRGYRIIYKVTADELLVLTVHHGAREYPPRDICSDVDEVPIAQTRDQS